MTGRRWTSVAIAGTLAVAVVGSGVAWLFKPARRDGQANTAAASAKIADADPGRRAPPGRPRPLTALCQQSPRQDRPAPAGRQRGGGSGPRRGSRRAPRPGSSNTRRSAGPRPSRRRPTSSTVPGRARPEHLVPGPRADPRPAPRRPGRLPRRRPVLGPDRGRPALELAPRPDHDPRRGRRPRRLEGHASTSRPCAAFPTASPSRGPPPSSASAPCRSTRWPRRPSPMSTTPTTAASATRP